MAAWSPSLELWQKMALITTASALPRFEQTSYLRVSRSHLSSRTSAMLMRLSGSTVSMRSRSLMEPRVQPGPSRAEMRGYLPALMFLMFDGVFSSVNGSARRMHANMVTPRDHTSTFGLYTMGLLELDSSIISGA